MDPKRSPLGNLSFNLPPLESNFNIIRGLKTTPLYSTNSMANSAPGKMEGFPSELIVKRDISKGLTTNGFTSSFVAGSYRDTRMGVGEMRERRLTRLRKRQEQALHAQSSLADEVARINEAMARKRARRQAQKLRRENFTLLDSVIKLQRAFKAAIARRKARFLEAEFKRPRKEQCRRKYSAVKLQRWALRFIALVQHARRLKLKNRTAAASANAVEEGEGGQDGGNTFLASLLEKQDHDERFVTAVEFHAGLAVSPLRASQPPGALDRLAPGTVKEPAGGGTPRRSQDPPALGGRAGSESWGEDGPELPGAKKRRERELLWHVLGHWRGVHQTAREGGGGSGGFEDEKEAPGRGGEQAGIDLAELVPGMARVAAQGKRLSAEQEQEAEQAGQKEKNAVGDKVAAEALVKLQCLARCRLALRVAALKRHEARERERADRAKNCLRIMARMPAEEPDSTGLPHWLFEDMSTVGSALNRRFRAQTRPPVGAIDLRRTPRSNFWLENGLGTGDNHLPPRLGLQLNPGASGRAVGSSVSSMLAESNRPTDYSKYTTP